MYICVYLPLVEENTIIPTTIKLNCWDHIVTSILKPAIDLVELMEKK